MKEKCARNIAGKERENRQAAIWPEATELGEEVYGWGLPQMMPEEVQEGVVPWLHIEHQNYMYSFQNGHIDYNLTASVVLKAVLPSRKEH